MGEESQWRGREDFGSMSLNFDNCDAAIDSLTSEIGSLFMTADIGSLFMTAWHFVSLLPPCWLWCVRVCVRVCAGSPCGAGSSSPLWTHLSSSSWISTVGVPLSTISGESWRPSWLRDLTFCLPHSSVALSGREYLPWQTNSFSQSQKEDALEHFPVLVWFLLNLELHSWLYSL